MTDFPYTLRGTYTVEIAAAFETAEKAQAHAADIHAEHTDVSLTLTGPDGSTTVVGPQQQA